MSSYLAEIDNRISNADLIDIEGKVIRLVGLVVESQGPPSSIGTICHIITRQGRTIPAEVVGFQNEKVFLMPLGTLEGITPGDRVISTHESLKIKVGPQLLGKILNGLGRPFFSDEIINTEKEIPVLQSPPNPLNRPRIKEIMATGIKAIDGLLTLGKGQRIGIFAGSGVGKSVTLGMIAKNSVSDVNVICLVGERGREVNDFLEKDLGSEGLKKSVIIVATSDQPSIIRVKCGLTAMAIAEYFRDSGKNVMFMMDSVTRIALALREIGLAVGEPPTTKAYTPSVFSFLPQLLERAGTAPQGTITGIFTVLVEGNDMEDPIADAVRGILDGHIVLSRQLAEKKHFPAIDPLISVSRLMSDIVSDEHRENAYRVLSNLAVYKNSEDLLNIGAYVRGSNKEIDLAVELYPRINEFLKQDYRESSSFQETFDLLKKISERG